MLRSEGRAPGPEAAGPAPSASTGPGAAGPAPSAAGGPVVVIGVGNEFRRDDGIGPEVLSRLRGQVADHVRLMASDGDPVRMIEAWTGASLAVVIDAVLADPPPASPSRFPGRLHRVALDRAGLADDRPLQGDPVQGDPVSSHGLGLGASIGLAQALGRMPGRLIIHAVEAADVGRGVGLSPAVAAAAGPLTAAVLGDLQQAH